jgi:putative oxidoreductase
MNDTQRRSLSDRLHSIRTLVEKLTLRLAWLPPALARLTLGVVFVQTGWGKLHSLDQVTRFFASLGIPAAGLQAPFVAGVEFFGGLLLLAGLGTRLVAVPLAGTMVVAILTAQRASVHGVGDLLGLIEFVYLVVFVWLAIAGPGALSLDHLLARRRDRHAAAASSARPDAAVVA